MVEEAELQQAADPGVGANVLRERERVAAEEAAAKADAYGRGRRAGGNVDYNSDRAPEGADGPDTSPVQEIKIKNGDESDTETSRPMRATSTAMLVMVSQASTKMMLMSC